MGRKWTMISLAGVATAVIIGWGLLVLPLLGIMGPAPGHEREAFLVAVAPPMGAGVLYLGASFVALQRSALTKRRSYPATGIVLLVIGTICVLYSALHARALLSCCI